MGRIYNRAKKANGVRGPQKLDQNDPASTAERLAKEHGVSAPTIKRDGKFAEDLSEKAKRDRASKAGAVGGRGRPKTPDSLSQDVCEKLLEQAEKPKTDTRAQAAKTARVSEWKVRQAQEVSKSRPDLAAYVMRQGERPVADWIDANQLGRRNLTPDQMSLLRGRRFNRAKKHEQAPSGQFVRMVHTAESIAKQHGVTEKTIRRDGKFAEAVEKVKVGSSPPLLNDSIRNSVWLS